MLAVLKEVPKANSISIREVDPPENADGSLIVKVKAVGICGSDLHAYHWRKDYEERYKGCLPVILGHEFTGVVESIGHGIEGFAIGEKVVARPGINCGHCYCCLDGNDAICQNRKIMGVHFNGAMAEYVVIPAGNCYKLPGNCSTAMGALLEPINVAYNAFLKAGGLLGKDVVIIGPGPLGYLISLFVEMSGAKSQIVSGLERDRLRMQKFRDFIKETELIENEEILYRRVAEKTDKRGADVVFEVSGSREGFQQSLRIVRRAGVVVLVGIVSDKVSVDSNLIVRGEIKVRGTLGATCRVWEEVLRFIESLPTGIIQKFERAITHKFQMSEAEKAFKAAEKGIGLKLLLEIK